MLPQTSFLIVTTVCEPNYSTKHSVHMEIQQFTGLLADNQSKEHWQAAGSRQVKSRARNLSAVLILSLPWCLL